MAFEISVYRDIPDITAWRMFAKIEEAYQDDCTVYINETAALSDGNGGIKLGKSKPGLLAYVWEWIQMRALGYKKCDKAKLARVAVEMIKNSRLNADTLANARKFVSHYKDDSLEDVRVRRAFQKVQDLAVSQNRHVMLKEEAHNELFYLFGQTDGGPSDKNIQIYQGIEIPNDLIEAWVVEQSREKIARLVRFLWETAIPTILKENCRQKPGMRNFTQEAGEIIARLVRKYGQRRPTGSEDIVWKDETDGHVLRMPGSPEFLNYLVGELRGAVEEHIRSRYIP